MVAMMMPKTGTLFCLLVASKILGTYPFLLRPKERREVVVL